MKDKVLALLMCGVLAMTLFACGEKRGTANDSDTLGDEQHYNSGTNSGTNNGTNNGTNSGTNNGTNGSNGSTHGNTSNGSTNSDANGGSGTTKGTMNGTERRIITGNNAKNSDVMGDSAVRGSTINPANGTADRTATWEQMLQNGRVHDKDGFLFDGENSHWA